jgi:hypothetical protein
MYKLKYDNITKIAKLKIAYLSINILINKYIKNKTRHKNVFSINI